MWPADSPLFQDLSDHLSHETFNMDAVWLTVRWHWSECLKNWAQ